MNRTLRILVVAAVAVASAAAGVWLARDRPAEIPTLERGLAFPTARALPAFTLLDQDGAAFGPGKLRGGWTVLFFGFTHCPDVCPATLATLAAARRQLSDLPSADQPQIMLVSVDPGRDTPALLRSYVGFFDPSFTAATGDAAQIDQLTRQLGVAVFRSEPDEQGNYTVDHTSTLFLVNPAGQVTAALSSPHEADVIARDIRRLLAAAGRA